VTSLKKKNKKIFLCAGKLFPFLANSNLENFFHLWQFRFSNLIIVFNYCDCWAEICLDPTNYLTMTLVSQQIFILTAGGQMEQPC
jgi:hypothetical protein